MLFEHLSAELPHFAIAAAYSPTNGTILIRDIKESMVHNAIESDLEFLMTDPLTALIEATKKIRQTAQQQEQQRRSFAYGNTAFENADITRSMIDEQAERLSVLQTEDLRRS